MRADTNGEDMGNSSGRVMQRVWHVAFADSGGQKRNMEGEAMKAYQI